MEDQDLAIVIRSAGERTLEVCYNLIVSQCGCSIEIVKERPFESALRRSYEIGIQQNSAWTMTVDADVMLRKGAVRALLAAAEAMPRRYFQLQGRIHDKITGLYRRAGLRIYRTSLLAKAVKMIPSPGDEIRPEQFVTDRMQELNYPARNIGYVAGLHDYEQYYRDLYRKAFVHAHKYRDLVSIIIQRCDELKRDDRDFLIILRGLQDELRHTGVVRLDVGDFSSDLTMILTQCGLDEKTQLSGNVVGFNGIEMLLKAAGPTPNFNEMDIVLGGPVDLETMPLNIGEQLDLPLIGFGRKTGDLIGDVIRCIPNEHSAGYCAFGSDFTLAKTGRYRTSFAVAKKDANGDVDHDVILDVYENRLVRKVLAETHAGTAHRKSDEANWVSLDFFGERGYTVEFRIYWRGTKPLSVHGISLKRLS
jgi:hypothetical protein